MNATVGSRGITTEETKPPRSMRAALSTTTVERTDFLAYIAGPLGTIGVALACLMAPFNTDDGDANAWAPSVRNTKLAALIA